MDMKFMKHLRGHPVPPPTLQSCAYLAWVLPQAPPVQLTGGGGGRSGSGNSSAADDRVLQPRVAMRRVVVRGQHWEGHNPLTTLHVRPRLLARQPVPLAEAVPMPSPSPSRGHRPQLSCRSQRAGRRGVLCEAAAALVWVCGEQIAAGGHLRERGGGTCPAWVVAWLPSG